MMHKTTATFAKYLLQIWIPFKCKVTGYISDV